MAENKLANDCHTLHAPQVHRAQLVVPEEPITTGLLIDESQISSFDIKLKEELVAQTLILTALSNNVDQNIQQQDFATSLPNIGENCANVFVTSRHHDIVNSIEEKNVNENQLLQNSESTFNVDTNIASQAIEMIAIQQSVTESDIKTSLLDTTDCQSKIKNLDEATIDANNLLNHQQISEALLEAGIAGSPVVINAIAIKDTTGVTEIQFDNSTDIQVEQTEVETNVAVVGEGSNQNISHNDSLTINDDLVLKKNEENCQGENKLLFNDTVFIIYIILKTSVLYMMNDIPSWKMLICSMA